MSTARLQPFALVGDRVSLLPIAADHVDGLVTAAAEDRQSYAYTWVPDGLEAMTAYVSTALQEQAGGQSLAWTVWDRRSQRIAGSTRYLDLQVFSWPSAAPTGHVPGSLPTEDRLPSVLEIGATWYAASAQRTAVNTECKYLLLSQAFDVWNVLRVSLKTDARNDRSRRAIERIGAEFEGVRLRHIPASDGTVRDTAYYSILAEDWPRVR